MKRISTIALLALTMTGSALAADQIVHLTLDGRPVDRAGGVAMRHHGIVYADLRDLVRAFNGLVTYQGQKSVVSVGTHVATFTLGSRTMLLDQGALMMKGQPFVRNGDVYVPLDAFVRNLARARVTYSGANADIRVNANPIS